MAISHIYDSCFKALRTIQTDVLLSEQRVTTPTGFHELDRVLKGGLRHCELTVVAGRPAQGKVIFVTNIAMNIANRFYERYPNQRCVMFVSTEQSSIELAMRIVASKTKVALCNIKNCNVSQADYIDLDEFAESLSDTPFFIDDTPTITISNIKDKMNGYYKEEIAECGENFKSKVDLLVIDNLQKLAKNSGLSVEDTLRELKYLSRDSFVSIVVASDLSDGIDNRQDKHPTIEDFVGYIDVIDNLLFLYREEYYLLDIDPENIVADSKIVDLEKQYNDSKGKAELICAKLSYNESETIKLGFDGDCCMFYNIDTTKWYNKKG